MAIDPEPSGSHPDSTSVEDPSVRASKCSYSSELTCNFQRARRAVPPYANDSSTFLQRPENATARDDLLWRVKVVQERMQILEEEMDNIYAGIQALEVKDSEQK